MKTGRLIVVLAPHQAVMSDAIAELALRGPVTVLDGGNCFPAYRIAQILRGRSVHVNSISKRIFLRRAFTCYQTTSLLENTPGLSHPHIVLNLLSTFQDDQVRPVEASRLLNICLDQIARLSLTAPIAVSLEPFMLEEKLFLLQRICDRANELFSLPMEINLQARQLSLFGDG